MSKSFSRVEIYKFPESQKTTDVLAVEEPLEIRLGFYDKNRFTHQAISITMRTPDHDFELAAGFLFTEGILQNAEQITEIKHCGKIGEGFTNTVRIDLQPNVKVDFKRLERHFYTSSSCGVCGKSSIEALQTGVKKVNSNLKIKADLVHNLPEMLRNSQTIFDATAF